MKNDSETALPFVQVFPTASDWQAERIAGPGQYQAALPTADRVAADSLPPSQLPRQHLSLGTNEGAGRRLLCCWRLCEFCWVES